MLQLQYQLLFCIFATFASTPLELLRYITPSTVCRYEFLNLFSFGICSFICYGTLSSQVKFIHYEPNAQVGYSEKTNWSSMSTTPKMNITANKISSGSTGIDI